MTAIQTAESSRDSLLERVGALRFLEGLARIHRLILLVDSRRNVVWASEALVALVGEGRLAPGSDARNLLVQLPRPQQVLPLRSSLRGLKHVTGSPIEFETHDGTTVALDLDLSRIDSEAGELLLVIASEHPGPGEAASQLVDSLPEAVLAVDEAGIVRHANPAALRLLETTEDQTLARPVATLLAETTDDVERLTAALATPDRSSRCQLGLRSRAGEQRTIDLQLAPLADGLRPLMLRDVSEEQRETQRLRKTADELEHCVGALAHDLRSPLAGLLGFTRLLREDYKDSLDESGRHFVRRIEQGARTMESMIQDLLELARIGAPGEGPWLVDPREVLQQLAAETKPRLEANGIELELSDDLPSRVQCDRSRLYQVLSNLIGNAIDHMGARSDARIEVRILEHDDRHEIVVSDNGRGVDPEQRERIFEIFQSIGTRGSGARGTGMGLAIVRKIAEKHGGRAWVDGEPGEGARFHVTLPRG